MNLNSLNTHGNFSTHKMKICENHCFWSLTLIFWSIILEVILIQLDIANSPLWYILLTKKIVICIIKTIKTARVQTKKSLKYLIFLDGRGKAKILGKEIPHVCWQVSLIWVGQRDWWACSSYFSIFFPFHNILNMYRINQKYLNILLFSRKLCMTYEPLRLVENKFQLKTRAK